MFLAFRHSIQGTPAAKTGEFEINPRKSTQGSDDAEHRERQ
jgi:hypothetical protein